MEELRYLPNEMVCNCMQVKYSTIVDALHENEKLGDALAVFDAVKAQTHCSTGCGGCHDKVMAIISRELNG